MGVGSIKCGHLDEGVFVVYFYFFFRWGEETRPLGRGGMMSTGNSCSAVSVNRESPRSVSRLTGSNPRPCAFTLQSQLRKNSNNSPAGG